MIFSIDNGKRWKAIQRNLLVWISGIPLTLEDVWNSGWEIFYLRLYFSWYLPARTANVIKPNRFCYYVQKDHGFRDNCLSVIVSTILISYLLISCCSSRVFSAVLFNLCQKKQQCRSYRYKSLKSWQIHNIDLTQQFDLSIFTDFRYQSIKITWLLSIFIDTDFYRLTTPGIIIVIYRKSHPPFPLNCYLYA